jgi:acetolactate synthase-1/3 small subunit
MSEHAVSTARAGQSDGSPEAISVHTLVALVNDRHGAVDRVVNILRRRRANMRAFNVSPSELEGVMRVTVVVDDSEVHVDQLAEQLRKIVDVRHIVNLSSEQALARELALIKVNCMPATRAEIIELSHLFGAHALDIAAESIMLEVTGSEAKLGKLLALLQPYGIREVARSGSVALAREDPSSSSPS